VDVCPTRIFSPQLASSGKAASHILAAARNTSASSCTPSNNVIDGASWIHSWPNRSGCSGCPSFSRVGFRYAPPWLDREQKQACEMSPILPCQAILAEGNRIVAPKTLGMRADNAGYWVMLPGG
jgi:hypothetical protein